MTVTKGFGFLHSKLIVKLGAVSPKQKLGKENKPYVQYIVLHAQKCLKLDEQNLLFITSEIWQHLDLRTWCPLCV